MDVVVDQPVQEADLSAKIAAGRDQPRRGRIMLGQIVDDDGGFRHHLPPLLVADHRELGQGPDRLERRPVGGIAQVDWKGEKDLAVPTPDGVKEPLNRRASININF